VDVLVGHRADLPFGAVYLLDEDGAGWIWQALTDNAVVRRDGLAEELPGLSTPGASPVGDAPVDVAVAVPLTASGRGAPSGVLVAGLSRYLPVDADYLGFVELVARQVSAAQRRRVAELAELDRAKTKFFTGVSHELRTPLALIELIIGTLRDVTAEHLSAERDAALVSLSTKLATIEDSARILSIGIAELRSVWHAERVSVVRWDRAGTPQAVATTGSAPPSRRALPAAGSEALSATGRIVTRVTGSASVTAIGAPITDGTDTVLVWVEFAGPRPFLASDQTLLTELCGHLRRALHRARGYEEQRAVALTLQRAILGPTELPDGFAVCYEPAAGALEVGGDWYDVVGMSDGRFGVVVGDVVGHSLAAATVMGQLRSAVRTLLLENHTPAEVLAALDRFAALIAGARTTTVFCAVIDPRRHQVLYSSAGHPPAILMGPDGVARHLDQALSLPLAIVDGLVRPEETAEMDAASTLLLYTDGLVEHLADRLLRDDHDDDVAFLTYRQPTGQADLWQ
jgi:hypothetical protein